MAALTVLADAGLGSLDSLPVSSRLVLEPVLRTVDGETITAADVDQSRGGHGRRTRRQPALRASPAAHRVEPFGR